MDWPNVLRDGKIQTVSPDTIAVGETIIVKPGERVALDGEIVDGTSALNTVALTGESAQEAEESPETGEESSEESTPEQEKKPDEGATETAPEPQKFTIKVNKGTREVELPEMTELAQKGADYDRVKGQLETSRTNEANLQKTR